MTDADDSLIRLIYEMYFSIPQPARQSVEWFVQPQAWEEIRRLKSGDGGVSMVVSMLNEDRCFLIGLPLNLDEHADWIELRS